MHYYFVTNIGTNFGPINLYISVSPGESIQSEIDKELLQRHLAYHTGSDSWSAQSIDQREYDNHIAWVNSLPLR